MGLLSSFLIFLTMGVATRNSILKDSPKYLFFRQTNDRYRCFPVNSFLGFTDDANNATGLVLYFVPPDRFDTGFYSYVDLTVTNHDDAIKDIMDAINFSKQTVINVADIVDSEFLSSSISSCSVPTSLSVSGDQT